MLTPPRMEHADQSEPHLFTFLKLTPSQSTPLLTSEPPLLKDQPPSPSKPTSQSSKDTPQVSSTPHHVEPSSITPLPLLVTEVKVDKTSSLLETHGPPNGETKVILELLPKKPPTGGHQHSVSAESNKSPSGQRWLDCLTVSRYDLRLSNF